MGKTWGKSPPSSIYTQTGENNDESCIQVRNYGRDTTQAGGRAGSRQVAAAELARASPPASWRHIVLHLIASSLTGSTCYSGFCCCRSPPFISGVCAGLLRTALLLSASLTRCWFYRRWSGANVGSTHSFCIRGLVFSIEGFRSSRDWSSPSGRQTPATSLQLRGSLVARWRLRRCGPLREAGRGNDERGRDFSRCKRGRGRHLFQGVPCKQTCLIRRTGGGGGWKVGCYTDSQLKDTSYTRYCSEHLTFSHKVFWDDLLPRAHRPVWTPSQRECQQLLLGPPPSSSGRLPRQPPPSFGHQSS